MLLVNGEVSVCLTPSGLPRIFTLLQQSFPSALARRRSARVGARRRRRLASAFFWTSTVLILLAFGSGFIWQKDWLFIRSDIATPLATSATQRAEALTWLERAIKARHSQLWTEASRLTLEARKADSTTPGVDILIGELALEQNEPELVGSAARAALQRNPACASAKLLLALHAWILGGQNGGGEAGAAPALLLKEAATDELSNGAVRFFAGDFLRTIGRPAEAHTNMLGSLYRQHAWHSAAVIVAKLCLAFEEAGAGALAKPSLILLGGAEGESIGALSVALHHAVRSSGDISSAGSALMSVLTLKQLSMLISDPALSSAFPKHSELISGFFIPFSEVAQSTEKVRNSSKVLWIKESKLFENN